MLYSLKTINTYYPLEQPATKITPHIRIQNVWSATSHAIIYITDGVLRVLERPDSTANGYHGINKHLKKRLTTWRHALQIIILRHELMKL